MPLTQLQRDHLARRLREERERVLRALRRYDERLTATEQDAAGDPLVASRRQAAGRGGQLSLDRWHHVAATPPVAVSTWAC